VYEVQGSWSQHVWSWTRNPHRALCIVRYEDMLADPQKTFGALAGHLQLDTTRRHLNRAIERSSFARLQAQEKEKGFRERPKTADQNFFREGRAGQWKDVLMPAQVDSIVRDHGEDAPFRLSACRVKVRAADDRGFRGNVLPSVDKKGGTVVIGNWLHTDGLMACLKNTGIPRRSGSEKRSVGEARIGLHPRIIPEQSPRIFHGS